MEKIMLATDVVLQAIIQPGAGSIEDLIAQAKSGEIQLTVLQSVLYFALYSLRENDRINTQRLAELLKYVQIISNEPEYLGPQERDSWVPAPEEVENWRRVALGES